MEIKMRVIDDNVISYSDEHGEPAYSGGINKKEDIVWLCDFPFIILYGVNSPITLTPNGAPSARGPVSYLFARNSKSGFKTQVAWINENAPNGTYKYSVIVFKRDNFDILTVDDPETIVPRPTRG